MPLIRSSGIVRQTRGGPLKPTLTVWRSKEAEIVVQHGLSWYYFED